jgi:hypothetical protein
MPWAYYATLTVSVWSVPYIGLVKGNPELDTSITDPLYGLVEYRDVRFTLINDGRFSPATVRNLRGRRCTLHLEERISGAVFNNIWTGTVSAAAMNGQNEVVVEGSMYIRSVLSQLVPTASAITADAFPSVMPGEIGKVAPIIYGFIEKHQCLYVNDGVGGQFDYLVCRGGVAQIQAVWRDSVSQGAAGVGAGAASFRSVPPSAYTIVTAPGNFTVIRFTSRQVSESGGLVGIYVDVDGFQAEKHPIQGIRYLLSITAWGLSQAVNAASFDAAAAQWDSLMAPDGSALDIVLGSRGQRRPAQDYLREWLMITGAHLGLNTDAEWTITLGLPPWTMTMALGSGTMPGIEQNLVRPGTRTWLSEEDRAKSVSLNYRYFAPTGTYQLTVSRQLDTVGREVVLDMPSIRSSAMADRVVDRIAKRLYYAQQRILNVETTLEGWVLDENSWVTYTDQATGCYQDVFLASRVTKTLTSVTVDLEGVSPSIWQYTPVPLPAEPRPVPIDSPPLAPPPTTPGGGGLLEERIEYVLSGSAPIVTPATYYTIATWVEASPTITIDTAGNDLYLQAFLEILVQQDPTTGGTGTARLRDVTTGASVVVGPITFQPDPVIFAGFTVYTVSFPSAVFILTQLGTTAGAHTIALEFQVNFANQEVFYGSRDVPRTGLPSHAYVLMRESS